MMASGAATRRRSNEQFEGQGGGHNRRIEGYRCGIAKRLSEAGAAVVNYSSGKEGADRVVDDIKTNGGRGLAVKGGVEDPPRAAAGFGNQKKLQQTPQAGGESRRLPGFTR